MRRWRSTRYRRGVAGVLTGVAVLAGVAAVRPPPRSSTPVVVADRDLRAGQVLRPDDVRGADVPTELVPAGASRDPSQVVGRVLAGPVRRGEPLTDVRLVGRALLSGLGPGQVAVPVRPADAGVLTLVEPGDRVDVLASTAAESPDGSSSSSAGPARLVAVGARVLSVPVAASGASASLLSSGADASASGPPLLLAVDRATAADLAGAATSRLSLELAAG